MPIWTNRLLDREAELKILARAETQLSRAHCDVLAALLRLSGPATTKQIAEQAGCDRSTVSRALRVLETAGFVSRDEIGTISFVGEC